MDEHAQTVGNFLDGRHAKAAARIAALEAELAAERERREAAEKDAARYRWLRGSPLDRGKCFSFDGLSLKCGADLDAAIDAAMGKD